MLGLAARAGAILPGTERVREAIRAGTVHFVLVAADASANSQDKLIPLLESRAVEYSVALTRDELGGAVGKAGVSAVGITEKNLALRVVQLLNE